jgi:hypothetical protein
MGNCRRSGGKGLGRLLSAALGIQDVGRQRSAERHIASLRQRARLAIGFDPAQSEYGTAPSQCRQQGRNACRNRT